MDPSGVDPDDPAPEDWGLEDEGGSSKEGSSSEGDVDVGGALPESSGDEWLGANLGADLRARKGALLGQLQELDDLADAPGLCPDNWISRNSLDSPLMDIFKGEELFWQRRGGQNWLLKGDANTAYFQAIANGRRRKCAIPFLWDGDTLLESPEEISSHIYSFYKELFSAEPLGGISVREDFWPLAEQVSDTENAELTIPLSPEEVGHAIATMKACSAPGPDGLPVIFF
ncbi:putative NOT transcription complex subunit VIP2 [Hordeum vulgare]|nr:putative NOT transcription complex subunit VIP2 [Hordeum vulgare]